MKRKICVVILLVIALVGLYNCKVEAVMKNNNPLLIDLTVDGETVKPEFDQFITDYVMAVNNSKEEVKIEAVTDDPNAKYEVKGDTKLKEGVNNFEIKVTAEDGTTTNSYFLHITRGNVDKANANLKNMEVKGLTLNPKFNEKDTNYYLEYEGYIEKLKIKAIPENDKAKVEIINGENINSTLHTVTVKVTAEDGITQKTYTITAKKKGDNAEEPSGLEDYEEDLKIAEEKKKREDTVKISMLIGAVIILVGVVLLVKKGKKK